MYEECIAESEDGADIVVLGYAVQHDRDRSALPGRKVVTGGFASAQLYRPTFGERRSLLGAISSG